MADAAEQGDALVAAAGRGDLDGCVRIYLRMFGAGNGHAGAARARAPRCGSALAARALLASAIVPGTDALLCCQFLLVCGADANHADGAGSTALALAAEAGLTGTAEVLLRWGASALPAAPATRTLDPPLCRAAMNGHALVVTLLLKAHGADDAVAAAVFAARGGHAEVLALLLNANVDAAAAAVALPAALPAAAGKGQAEVVVLLLKAIKGGDTAAAEDWAARALLAAAKKGHAVVIGLLLEAIKGIDNAARCALFTAAKEGHAAVIALLLEAIKGVSYTAAAADSVARALVAAAKEGHAAVIALLLEAIKGDPICGQIGSRALVAAAKEGHAAVIALLLDAGADTAGTTAYDLAKKHAGFCPDTLARLRPPPPVIPCPKEDAEEFLASLGLHA